MHGQTFELMASFANTIQNDVTVLDVGSADVNESFRKLFRNQRYLGLDIIQAENVDVVAKGEYEYSFPDNFFDYIVSGSCLEHVKMPWLWIKEIARILKVGGKLCIIAPYEHPYHEHPVDCWRIFPEGMKALFEYAGLETISSTRHYGEKKIIHPILGEITILSEENYCDTMGIARKV